jgi:hypothetical protein
MWPVAAMAQDRQACRPAPPADRLTPGLVRGCRRATSIESMALSESEGQEERAPTRLIDLRGLLTGSDASCGAQNRMFPGWGRAAAAAVPFVGRLAVFRFSVA